MKKLLMIGLVMAVLGISAQANAYVLVYNLFGTVQAVDTAANGQVTQFLNGYIVMNINDTEGTVDGSSVILYGRQGWNNKFYTIDDDIVNFTAYGNFVTLIVDDGLSNRIVLTGRLRNANVGAATREKVADPLSGAMTLQNGQIFNLDQSLIGAGAMQAILNGRLTRSVNTSGTAFDDVVNSILSNLESRGFQWVDNQADPGMPS
jgi:hypothetical protein